MFYSGYSLKDDKSFFSKFIVENEFTYSGFSYGSIEAFEKVYSSEKRVDLLQLFSPVFFQTYKSSFIKLQLRSYDRSKDDYLNNFIGNCFLPSKRGSVNSYEGSREDLEILLNYKWDEEKLKSIIQRGTKIEVYLGSSDKIIDVENAKEFFLQFATLHIIQEGNHFLQKS